MAYDNKHATTMFIAGPAAESKQPPAGEVSAAAADSDGHVHVAFVRVKDGTLWYANRKKGSWAVEQLTAVAAGTAGDQVDIALWQGRPTIVYRGLAEHGLHMLHRSAAGTWQVEHLPNPPAVSESKPDLGAALAISPWGDVVFVVTYDATEGDLVLAVRKDGNWTSTRQAANPLASGSSDVGLPSAVARSLAGDLVIAYRDRDRNQVRMLRTEAGKSVNRLVSDGAHQLPQGAQRRRHMVGTALSVVTLANGRVAIAYLNASQMRIHVAIQGGDGSFSIVDVPHHSGRPQAWPRLLSQVDGTLLVAYLELDPAVTPPGGRLLTWTLPVAAVQP